MPPDLAGRAFGPQERQAVLAQLAAKAKLTEQVFNEAPGIRCNPVQGAMYSFPSMQLPPRAVKRAQVRRGVGGARPAGEGRGLGRLVLTAGPALRPPPGAGPGP